MKNKFFNQQPLRSWQSTLNFYFWRLLSRLESSSPAPMTRFRQLLVLVRREIHATLTAVLKATSNKRIYLGLVLICSAWFAEEAFRLADQKAVGWSEYWNAYYFLHAIGHHAALIMVCTGVYFLFPEKSKEKIYALIPVPFKFAKIIWLAFTSTNEGFHSFWYIGLILFGVAATNDMDLTV